MKTKSGLCAGDRVVLIKGSLYEEGAQTGEIGTVYEVVPRSVDEFDLVYVLWDSGKTWSFLSRDVRIIDEEIETTDIECLF